MFLHRSANHPAARGSLYTVLWSSFGIFNSKCILNAFQKYRPNNILWTTLLTHLLNFSLSRYFLSEQILALSPTSSVRLPAVNYRKYCFSAHIRRKWRWHGEGAKTQRQRVREWVVCVCVGHSLQLLNIVIITADTSFSYSLVSASLFLMFYWTVDVGFKLFRFFFISF